MNKPKIEYLDSILKTYQTVKDYHPTLSPSQYEYYKEPKMPAAKTIIKKFNQSWNELLQEISLPAPLDRQTLARLSKSLHLLEKGIVDKLNLGWNESNFTVKGRYLRPDASYSERMYLEDQQLLILDVKLSICSSLLTVYKYLPIFENKSQEKQLTFFTNWMDDDKGNEPEPHGHGQLNFFSINNILYICYLVGKPHEDMHPNSEISSNAINKKKMKRLPADMEVRFIEFSELPELYCYLANKKYNKNLVKPHLDLAQDIKDVVMFLPNDFFKISQDILVKAKELVVCG